MEELKVRVFESSSRPLSSVLRLIRKTHNWHRLPFLSSSVFLREENCVLPIAQPWAEPHQDQS
jgi:hypothetical protein